MPEIYVARIDGFTPGKKVENYLNAAGEVAKGAAPCVTMPIFNGWMMQVDQATNAKLNKYMPAMQAGFGAAPMTQASANAFLSFSLNQLDEADVTALEEFKAGNDKSVNVEVYKLTNRDGAWTESFAFKCEGVQVTALTGAADADVSLTHTESTTVNFEIAGKSAQQVIDIYPAAAAA
tara:strand:- start:100856 stop:101389 length:534 start_codon:yes stop_codon:yes gene_type:complete